MSLSVCEGTAKSFSTDGLKGVVLLFLWSHVSAQHWTDKKVSLCTDGRRRCSLFQGGKGTGAVSFLLKKGREEKVFLFN